MDEQATRLRARMVERLIASGALRSQRWKQAFSSVPRHAFLPEFFALADDGMTYTTVNETDGADWLRAIYSDEALVTQLDAGAGTDCGAPTSSSSAPALMAQMLEALDVTDNSRVLELGTGTGYNAALLCAGLTDAHLTSVDIDAGLVARARAALARLGYRPTLEVTDGDSSTSHLGGRYDRLIVTYGVPRIPASWLDLPGQGGVIVAAIHREQPVGAMVRLTVESPQRASGHLLPFYGAFMPTRRRGAATDLSAALDAARSSEGTTRATALPRLFAGHVAEPWQFYAALALGDIQHIDLLPDGDPDPARLQHWLIAPDGSWAYQEAPRIDVTVQEGGPRRLWAELESAHTRWHEFGKPARERFGLTVTPDTQELWLDEPTNVISRY